MTHMTRFFFQGFQFQIQIKIHEYVVCVIKMYRKADYVEFL